MKLLKNGKIYTENPAMPWAQALVIDGRNFAFVGSNEEAEAFVAGREVEVRDLGGKTVLPGLIDGHSHPSTIARDAWLVYGDALVESREKLFAEIRRCVQEYPPDVKPYLVYAYYANEATFGDDGPSLEDLKTLDAITGDRPVRINDDTGHGCWYNSAALEMLKGSDGVPTSVSPLAGVTFVKDASGAYTGQAFQTFQQGDTGVFRTIGWEPPTELNDENAKPIFDVSRHFGVTGIMEAGVEHENDLVYLSELDKRGELNLFYDACSLMVRTSDVDAAVARAKDWQKRFGSDHIRINTIKFFGDGSNEFGDVLSTEPFPCDPTTCGKCNCTVEEMRDVMVRLNQEGLDLHMHTVCDGTIRVMLDACEQAQKICGKDWRIRVTLAHCEVIHPDDVHRFHKLGVWVDWTPSWSGDPMLEAIPYIGKKRWQTIGDFSGIMADGDIVGFSTDEMDPGGVHKLNPFHGIQRGITRVSPEVKFSAEYYPEGQRGPERAKMTLTQMIHGFTMTNAKRMRLADKMGSVEVGKLANLVVLQDDIFSTPPEKISEIRVDGTYFEGKELHIPNPLER